MSCRNFTLKGLAFIVCVRVLISPALLYAGTATLSWTPPTTNIDGTPLTDLAGYKVFHGTTSGNYTTTLLVGNVTTFEVINLSEGNTYFFTVKAVDTAGNESGFSNEISKTITASLSGLSPSTPNGVNNGQDSTSGGGCGFVRDVSSQSRKNDRIVINLTMLALPLILVKMRRFLKAMELNMRTILNNSLTIGMLLIALIGWYHLYPVKDALAVEPICPGGTNPVPNVIWCEDFEDGMFLNRWSVGSQREVLPPQDFVRCDNGSFGFGDRCGSWSGNLIFDGDWGYWAYQSEVLFPPQSEFYIRWYLYISENYQWGSIEDKTIIINDQPRTIGPYIAANGGGAKPKFVNYQDLDWAETGGQFTLVNRGQNQGNDITLQLGKWYFFEWHIKLNTPGVSNGVTKLWVDDATLPISTQTLRLAYSDIRFLKNVDAGKQLGRLRLTVYNQRCDFANGQWLTPTTTKCPPNGPSVLNQHQRWDNIVISKTPIGPVGGLVSDRVPPSPPSGLTVKTP